MGRSKNSLENNCNDVLDNSIKNIKLDLRSTLLLEVLEAGLENNKKVIEKFLRTRLNLVQTFSKHAVRYWTIRGWTTDEAYVKAKDNKQKNRKSVYSREFWLEKINPNTTVFYTIEEADFERNSRRPIRKEYWIKKGYTEDDAIRLSVSTKTQNNKKGALGSAKTELRKVTSKRCSEYYTARGFTYDEAKDIVSDGQRYFSKDICIKKYGEIDGIRIWQDRQSKWQSTLNLKSTEEKSRINRLKLTKGITVSSAEHTILAEIKKVVPEIVHQFTLCKSDKKQYIYDLAANNKIIEYNGDFWHCNPEKFNPEFVNPKTKIKAVDKWELDRIKLQYAIEQGYKVLVIWESDFKKDKDKVIKQCIQFLTQ